MPTTLPVPLQGNIRGPIALTDLRHACFPWRMMAKHEFITLSVPAGRKLDACIPDHCPSESDEPACGQTIAVHGIIDTTRIVYNP